MPEVFNQNYGNIFNCRTFTITNLKTFVHLSDQSILRLWKHLTQVPGTTLYSRSCEELSNYILPPPPSLFFDVCYLENAQKINMSEFKGLSPVWDCLNKTSIAAGAKYISALTFLKIFKIYQPICRPSNGVTNCQTYRSTNKDRYR